MALRRMTFQGVLEYWISVMRNIGLVPPDKRFQDSNTPSFHYSGFLVERCPPIVSPLDEVHDHRRLCPKDSVYSGDFVVHQYAEVIKGFHIKIDVNVRTTGRESDVPYLLQIAKRIENVVHFLWIDVDTYASHDSKANLEGITDGDDFNDSVINQLLQTVPDSRL